MDASGQDKAADSGDDGREDISEDSGGGDFLNEVIDTVPPQPIAVSLEDGHLNAVPPPNPRAEQSLCNKTEDTEYFDVVSDTEDIPDDEDGDGQPCSESTNVCSFFAGSAEPAKDKNSTCEDVMPKEFVTLLEVGERNAGDLLNIGEATKLSEMDASGVATSQSEGPAQLHLTHDLEFGVAKLELAKSSSLIEKPVVEIGDTGNEPEVHNTTAQSQNILSSAHSDLKAPVESDSVAAEGSSAVHSQSALAKGAESVSDISSDGEVPVSDEEDDKQSAEKLSQQAAHQAEVLAPLGAEPVSEPESGEELGSDESSPPSPGFGVTAGGYLDLHHRLKTDSLGVHLADRLSLEDSAGTPLTSIISNEKLSLSALDMETISDDENIGDDDNDTDTSGEIVEETDPKPSEETTLVVSAPSIQPKEGDSAQPENSVPSDDKAAVGEVEGPRRPTMIATLGDKQQVQTQFNEEAVELDYEDVDGEGEVDEEGEIKAEEEEGKEEGEDSGKDEGELDDDDDCEEGEIKEPGTPKKPFQKPICRFYQRGQCTWGLNCRFLHPGVNDKGNYQMIEIPGMRWNGPGSVPAWAPEIQEEPVDLPPPPEVPREETAWERGLRQAKEQMKKASQRKEHESNFEEKRLNLSVDEDREMNKENERRTVMHVSYPKDPYYDQAEYDEEEYYKQPRVNQWQGGQYENFEVRYNRDVSYSPHPYREKEYFPPPPERYLPRQISPPVDKFGRDRREDLHPDLPYRNNRMPEPRGMTPPSPSPASAPYRRPDEWHDPWRRSKSPKLGARRGRSHSRTGRGRRSLSDSTFSSNSRSRSGSSGSHSSVSHSSISSKSGSRSPEPAPPGVERAERPFGGPQSGRYMDGPRSAVSVRGGRGGGDWRDPGGRNQGGNYNNNSYNHRNFNRGHGGGGPHRNQHQHGRRSYAGQQQQQQQQQVPERSFPPGYGYNRPQMARGRQNERRIPPDALRPRKSHSGSSRSSSHSRSASGSRSGSSSSSSRSGSRSGSSVSRSQGSRSGSASSASSHTSRSSSSSTGSADSDNLYRDLGRTPARKRSVKAKTKEGVVGLRPPMVPPLPMGPPELPRVPGDRKRPAPDNMHRRHSGGHFQPPGHHPPPPSSHPHAPSRPSRPEGHHGHRLPPGEPLGGRMAHSGRSERPDRPDFADRVSRGDRGDRVDRIDRADRIERASRPERGPERGAERGLERGPDRVPERGPDRMPERGPDRMPERGPNRIPDRGPDRMPERGIDRMPERGPDRIPDRGPDRMLERGPDRIPDRGPDRMPERGPDRIPDRGPDRMPERGPDRISDRGPDRIPDRGPDRIPDRGPDRMPERGPEKMPERGPDRIPERGPDRILERGPDRMLERGPDRIPERLEESRPERLERSERMERDRSAAIIAGSRPPREQSSRPPPQSQPKAKDPMKLMGLKSNIKLSLVNKQASEKPGSVLPSSPLKRRPIEVIDGPPAKRPTLPPASPVKIPSEKAAKPSSIREPRARSPSERQPRSGAAGISASLPTVGAAASIPLPASPTKAPVSKPRPPAVRPAHAPPPPGKPAPPPAPPAAAPPAAAKVKKSTTSRREELLKQLKAVEDAIARKKAKMQ